MVNASRPQIPNQYVLFGTGLFVLYLCALCAGTHRSCVGRVLLCCCTRLQDQRPIDHGCPYDDERARPVWKKEMHASGKSKVWRCSLVGWTKEQRRLLHELARQALSDRIDDVTTGAQLDPSDSARLVELKVRLEQVGLRESWRAPRRAGTSG